MKRILYPTVLGIALVLFAVQFRRYVALRARLASVGTAAPTAVPRRRPARTHDNDVSAIAKRTGTRLLTITEAPRGSANSVRIEFEAALPASVAFLTNAETQFGRCRRLRLVPVAGRSDVRADAEFDPTELPPPAGPAGPNGFTHPLFAALEVPSSNASAETSAREAKRAEEARAREAVRLDQERQERERRQALDAKKSELETQLLLSGIVNNGHEPLAFVTSRGGNGGTSIVRSGDTVSGARVAAIDEKRGEVQLDYLGQLHVVLRLDTAAGVVR